MKANQSLFMDRPVSVSGANGEAIFDRIEEPKVGREWKLKGLLLYSPLQSDDHGCFPSL